MPGAGVVLVDGVVEGEIAMAGRRIAEAMRVAAEHAVQRLLPFHCFGCGERFLSEHEHDVEACWAPIWRGERVPAIIRPRPLPALAAPGGAMRTRWPQRWWCRVVGHAMERFEWPAIRPGEAISLPTGNLIRLESKGGLLFSVRSLTYCRRCHWVPR